MNNLKPYHTEFVQRFKERKFLSICYSTVEVFHSLLQPSSLILDVGASISKTWKQHLNSPTQRYFSLDIDREAVFDFYSFEEMPASLVFDVMVAHQVLEHIPAKEVQELLLSAYQHLSVNGCFLATVPNPAHPINQWADSTHCTHWAVPDLYALFRLCGFNVVRLERLTKYRLPRNPVQRIITLVTCDIFDVDWADALLIVGKKEAS